MCETLAESVWFALAAARCFSHHFFQEIFIIIRRRLKQLR